MTDKRTTPMPSSDPMGDALSRLLGAVLVVGQLDQRQAVGAESAGGGGEFRDGDEGCGGRGEVATVGDEAVQYLQYSPDAPEDRARWFRGGGRLAAHGFEI